MPKPKKINIETAFDRIDGLWSPHVARKVNSQEVRLAKIEGEFDWHFHEGVEEAFFVVKGGFEMHFRNESEEWNESLVEGDLIVVPAGVEHRPVAAHECWIMMIEDAGTLNTGNVETEKTKRDLPTL